MNVEKPPIILANWHEDGGPAIIASIFPPELAGTAHTPEVLISRCYISTESIFAKGDYSKTNFTLPMLALKKLALVNVDALDPNEGNGRKDAFFLVIFLPLDTHSATVDAVLEIVEPRIEEYKNGKVPDLELLQDEVSRALETNATRSGASKTQDEAKQELSEIVKDRISKMADKGMPLKVINCPACGFSIFPDELACTQCRFIVRTFCAQCNAMIDRSLKFCPKCGLPNPRYEPVISLFTMLDEKEAESREKGIGTEEGPRILSVSPAVAAFLGMQKASTTPETLERDLDASMQAMEGEIEAMKKDLESRQDDDPSKARLLDAFSRDRLAIKDYIEDATSRFQDIMLQNPASDDAVRLINRLAGASLAVEDNIPPEAVLLSWDCDAYLQSGGRLLVGRGERIDDADGIPGTMFVTETALIFISFKENLDDASNVFSYFDASLQHLGDCNTFSPRIKNNAIEFKIHGMCAKKLPLEHSMAVNFSWIPGEEDHPWVNQAIALRSVLKHQKEHPERPPAPAGIFLQFSGKSPFDNAIKSVLANLQLYFPQVLKKVVQKYPMLF
jgi:hypothetical protein